MEFEAALRDQVRKAVGGEASRGRLTKLKGDASNRSYYRIGDPPSSYVLMVMAPESARKSEELSKGQPDHELPFINVQRYLKKVGARVPEILHYDERAGIMLLEDLGDLTFEKALAEGRDREELYQRAVDLLANLRAQA